MKRYIYFLIILIIVINVIVSCKEKKVQKNNYNMPQQFVDVELQNWKKEFGKTPFILKISQLPNPFKQPVQMSEKKEPKALGIKLVGIIKKRGEYYALVEDQNKISYLVKKNQSVGDIKIINIRNTYIIVKQKIITPMGKVLYITKKVSLTKE